MNPIAVPREPFALAIPNRMRWRYLDSGALDGDEQMALDAGLMERARETGESVLRLYQWARPTLSFGRNEAARDRFSPEALDAAGVGAVRRPTGGRALLHDREVTYSVTAPADEREPLGASYRRINALLLEALRRLGVHAQEAPPGRSLRPEGAACFAAPAAGELVVDGHKLVGSAQIREQGALLQHGSILIEDDQPRILALANGPLIPALPAATLRSCLGYAPAYSTVRDTLIAALRAHAAEATPLEAAEAARYGAPHRAHFADAGWTWRR